MNPAGPLLAPSLGSVADRLAGAPARVAGLYDKALGESQKTLQAITNSSMAAGLVLKYQKKILWHAPCFDGPEIGVASLRDGRPGREAELSEGV
jgi:hypothetical protein